ncbi:MAG: NAD-dependent epimerase/dehydratase family protein [Victivallales bacterium]|nr:NAD-dependent epimerase/dehydratase family protein [Victivallales bacterium]
MSKEKKVLVLGATGAMGRYLVPYLAELGYRVDGASLDSKESDNPLVRYFQGNGKEREFLDSLLQQTRYDAIVDFLTHGSGELPMFLSKMLDNTDQYVYISSARVYDNLEHPVRESSPRLIDTTKDPLLKYSDDYCIFKARGENLLREYGTKKNWTIIRPATTFSFMRYQLVTLEAPDNVGRAFAGKTVVVPETARYVSATLGWGGDVAKMIGKLLFNDRAYGEDFNVHSAEHHTWQEIADYYKDICNLKALWVPQEDYLKIKSPDPYAFGIRWQLVYARLFERVMDNSKVLTATGMQQKDLMPLYDGLKMEISRTPRDYQWPVNVRMDEYLAARGLV